MSGIDRTRPGGAVAGAEHIDADHAVAAGLEQASVGEQARPPIRDPGRAGERVGNEDDVVARRIGLAIDRIAEGGRLQHPAGFEGESLAWREVSLETGCDQRRAGAGAHRALSASTGLAE